MPAAGGGVHGVEGGMALDEGAQLAPGEAESGFEEVRGGVAWKFDHNFALYRAGPLPKWSGVRYNLRKMAAAAKPGGGGWGRAPTSSRWTTTGPWMER